MQPRDTEIGANKTPHLLSPSMLYAFKINLGRQSLAAFVWRIIIALRNTLVQLLA